MIFRALESMLVIVSRYRANLRREQELEMVPEASFCERREKEAGDWRVGERYETNTCFFGIKHFEDFESTEDADEAEDKLLAGIDLGRCF